MFFEGPPGLGGFFFVHGLHGLCELHGSDNS